MGPPANGVVQLDRKLGTGPGPGYHRNHDTRHTLAPNCTVREPPPQLRLAFNHRLPQPATPCRTTPRSARLWEAHDAQRRGTIGQGDEGTGIGASGARVRPMRGAHPLPGPRAGLVRGRRRRTTEELPVRGVRGAAYPGRPRGRSRRSTFPLTAVSWTPNARDSDTMASKNTRRLCSREVGFWAPRRDSRRVRYPRSRRLVTEVGDMQVAGGLAHCPLAAPVVAGGRGGVRVSRELLDRG